MEMPFGNIVTASTVAVSGPICCSLNQLIFGNQFFS